MNRIIALWCHPRSMSTAVERIMRERGDCACFHEPFMYDYYIHRNVRAMPYFDVEPDRPVAYADIRDHLLAAVENATVFIKDMSYYVVPTLFDDTAFARRLTHAFQIRRPARSILSYYRFDPDMTLEEMGPDWLDQILAEREKKKPAIKLAGNRADGSRAVALRQ